MIWNHTHIQSLPGLFFLPFVLFKKNWPGDEASVSPDISVDSHVILYNEWVCDEWWFTCSHYLDSVQGGTTALFVAAQNGHVEAVGLLIAAKAQVDIQRKVRFTACVLVIIWMCIGWLDCIVRGQSPGSLWSCQDVGDGRGWHHHED